jgi:predicted ATPase/transcriptional regulator with XRE-family HTH domain
MPATRTSAVGDLLKRFRLAAGLTQEQLAERAGLSARGLSDIERGLKPRPHRDTIALLADALALGPTERATLIAATGRPVEAATSDRVSPKDPSMEAASDHLRVRSNLPVALTSFIGREQEIGEVKRVLKTTRLLTLTGSGGCGKSRLALRIATGLVGEYPDGVWLVELAALGDPGLVAQTMASALGVPESPTEPMVAILRRFLGAKQLLLVLDNCEHLIVACAEIVDELLRHCPGVTILATSREGLRIAGEVTWRVPSLPLPPTDVLPTVEQIAVFDAVRLFVERAEAVQSSFGLTEGNGATIAQICRRLDGIPLAIELAAGRVNGLSIEQIGGRLGQRFRLLTGGSRTALARYQTLRASIAWSHDLLSEAERVVFRRLAVFAGGFSLAGAEAVCGDAGVGDPVSDVDGRGTTLTPTLARPEGHPARENRLPHLTPDTRRQIPAEGVFDLLMRLVDKSLVQADPSGGEVRFRLLETLREYAWERLDAAEEAKTVRRAHLAWCLNLAERVSAVPVTGHERVEALERVVADMANVRAALGWCLDHDVTSGLRLAGNLFWLWSSRYVVEGCRWLVALVDRDTRPNLERARGVAFVSYLVGRCGDTPRGAALAEESLRGDQLSSADPFAASVARSLLAVPFIASGNHAPARQLLEENLATCREMGELWGEADTTWKLGMLDQLEGNRTQARARYAEALACFRQAGEAGLTGQLLMMQGDLARLDGDFPRARELLEESLRLGRASGNREGVSWSLDILGNVLRAEGDYAQADELFAESLAYYDDFGVKPSWSRILGSRANLARLRGHRDQARTRLKDALVVMQEVGNALRIAEGLCFAGMLAVQEGDAERGARLLGAAFAFGPMFANEFDPVDLAELEKTIASAKGGLGEAAYKRAWAEGHTLSFDQALELALA